MGTTADKLNLLLNSKADIKAALVEKGQTVSDVFSEYGDKIRAIQTGVELPALTNPAAEGQVLSGYEFIDANGAKKTGSVQSKAAATYTPGTDDQTIASGVYLSGVQTIKGDANLDGANIVDGKTIFGKTGTAEPASALADTLTTQDDLIGQIMTALEGKTAASGVSLEPVTISSGSEFKANVVLRYFSADGSVKSVTSTAALQTLATDVAKGSVCFIRYVDISSAAIYIAGDSVETLDNVRGSTSSYAFAVIVPNSDVTITTSK